MTLPSAELVEAEISLLVSVRTQLLSACNIAICLHGVNLRLKNGHYVQNRIIEEPKLWLELQLVPSLNYQLIIIAVVECKRFHQDL